MRGLDMCRGRTKDVKDGGSRQEGDQKEDSWM